LLFLIRRKNTKTQKHCPHSKNLLQNFLIKTPYSLLITMSQEKNFELRTRKNWRCLVLISNEENLQPITANGSLVQYGSTEDYKHGHEEVRIQLEVTKHWFHEFTLIFIYKPANVENKDGYVTYRIAIKKFSEDMLLASYEAVREVTDEERARKICRMQDMMPSYHWGGV
jgi:hypothetical protein